VLSSLGAVVNELICNQWERKGMKTNVFLWLMQYGTRGECPSSCCKVFFLTFLNCRFMLAFLQLNSSVCSLSEPNMQQARQC